MREGGDEEVDHRPDLGGRRPIGRMDYVDAAKLGRGMVQLDRFERARGQGVGDDELRQVGDAEAGDGTDCITCEKRSYRWWARQGLNL